MYSFLYLIEQPCLAALKKTLEINVIQISTWITLALLYVKCVHFSWLIFSGIWLVARNRCVPTFVPYDKSNQNNNMESVQIQVAYRVCVSLFVFCYVFFGLIPNDNNALRRMEIPICRLSYACDIRKKTKSSNISFQPY